MDDEIFSVGGRETRIVFTPEMPALEEGDDRLAVFDEGTAALCSRIPRDAVVLPRGEGAKEWNSVEKILRAAFRRGMARDSVFVGVGGGMV
mgnify:CR=1 FL=1